LHCEEGIFPTISKKTTQLRDPALKASRWEPSLRFEGRPWGNATRVFRRAGLWQVGKPPFDCIEASVEVLHIPGLIPSR
jgi:hypothetical protein